MEPCLVQTSISRALIVLQNRPGGSKVCLSINRVTLLFCFIFFICFVFVLVISSDGAVA